MNTQLATNRRPSAWTFALVFAPALLLLALTVLVSIGADLPLALFSRDPMATMNGHPLTGVLSTLGILVWCGAVAICLFSAATLQGLEGCSSLIRFFAFSGAITLMLALDDLFMIHDDLGERYLRVGEKPVLLVYAALVGWYVISFRRVILRSDFTLLILAFLLFGFSVVVDLFQGRWLSPWRIFVEDGFKFLGIMSWSGYLIRACFQAVAAAAAARARVAKGEHA